INRWWSRTARHKLCSASNLLGAQQRFPSPSPPQKRRRGLGRGGRFSSVSPLSSSLPARSSRGEREKALGVFHAEHYWFQTRDTKGWKPALRQRRVHAARHGFSVLPGG